MSSAISSQRPKPSASTTTSSRRIDQPWKISEGSVGAYWGLFNGAAPAEICLDRHRSPIRTSGSWHCSRLLMGVLFSLPLLAMSVTLIEAAVLAVAAHVVGAWFAGCVRLLERPLLCLGRSLRAWPWRGAAGAAGADCDGEDRGDRRDRVRPQTASPAPGDVAAARARRPGLRCRKSRSISRPISEAPEMLKATLDAVARLNYPNFECIVIINNTPDPALLGAGRGALQGARRALQVPAR